jgi:hypothetical protein
MVVNQKVLKQAAAVGALVGVGALAARVGGRAARRSMASIEKYASSGPGAAAVVDGAAGLLLDVVGLVIAGKVAGASKAAKAAPFVVGGTALAAVGPMVADKASAMINSGLDKLLPSAGGLYSSGDGDFGGALLSSSMRADVLQLPPAGGMYDVGDFSGELGRGTRGIY